MDTISLKDVLEVFSVPLSEEQAWAVCYQSAKYLEDQRAAGPSECCIYKGIESVVMCKDGTIERCDTLHTAEAVPTEYELIQSLGLVIYQALDYGLDEAEEHKLSPALESLIEHMTADDDSEVQERHERSYEDTDGDEGIENDVDDEDRCREAHTADKITIANVLQFCSAHLQNPTEASVHYKAVCRAIVAESFELTTFLEKVSAERERLSLDMDSLDAADQASLECLDRGDWARLWIQMMRELRQGVKLRKVDHVHTHHSVEFELTPYEILMEDIRTRRYTLNKVTVNSLPPSTRKDAHHVMLEFIRSRPPLHPAKDRKLGTPPPSTVYPRDQLLRAIRSDPKLRPTPGSETSRTKLNESDDTPATTRKIIKPDFKFCLSDEDDDLSLSEDEDDDPFDDKNKVTPSPLSPLSPLSPQTCHRVGLRPPAAWHQTVLYDLVTVTTPVLPRRRHSITVCQTPEGSTSRRVKRTLESSLECLSLTIEEVMHIRNVLTKAEVESLLVNPDLHALVDKGKICFTCKQTKFSLFGNWSTKCKFCQRYVCSKCVSKMQIPTEHFEHIPVYTLSPSPLTPGSENDIFVFDATGSVPVSPARNSFSPSSHSTPQQAPSSSNPDISRSISTPSDTHSHHSDQSHPSPETSAGPFSRLKELARQGAQMAMSNGLDESSSPPPDGSIGRPSPQRSQQMTRQQTILQGPTMNICRDCKAMIIGIIRASRSSLKNAPGTTQNKPGTISPLRKPNRNFHLDLKPVYKAGHKK